METASMGGGGIIVMLIIIAIFAFVLTRKKN